MRSSDTSTTRPLPVWPLLEHRRQDPGQSGQPADVVPDAAAGVERHALAVGQLDRQTRAGPEGADVVGRAVPVLAAQAVPAHAAVDEPRVAGHRGRRLEPEAVERVGAQVGEEHVRRGQQLLQPLPGLGVAHVEDDAALAPVVLREGGVRQVPADAEGTEGAAHRVAVGRLHLDDVRAPVGQQRAGRGCGDPDTHLDHPQAGQRGQTFGRPVAVIGTRRPCARRPAPGGPPSSPCRWR